MKKIYVLLFVCTMCTMFAQSQTIPTLCTDDPLFADTSFHKPVAINEFLLEGYNGECWVEIRNCRADSVDIGGYFFSNTPTNYTLFSVTGPRIIPPYGLDTINLPFLIPLSFGTIHMSRPIDTVDEHSVTCDAMHIGESLGFCDMQLFRQIPTPNEENTCEPFPLGIIELSTGCPDFLDVEIFNLTCQKVYSSKNREVLPHGIYLLVVYQKGRIIQKKIMYK